MPIEVGAPGVVLPPAAALLHTARRNEERGFDTVWWPDHLMGWHPSSVWTADRAPLAAVVPNPHTYFDPVAAVAAAAGVTERIKLGVAVTEAVRNHPAQLARAWLTLDHLTGGRAVLGMGAGEGENITPYGIPFDRPATRLEDALRVVRLLWGSDGPVDYDGPVFRLRDAVCGMKPLTPGRPPPIWVAAHGPRLCRVAGELADGWLPTTLLPDEYAERWAQVREGARAAGRDPDSIVAGMWSFTVVAEDHEAAHRYLAHPMVKAFALALPDHVYARRGAAHPLGRGTHGFLEYVPSRLEAAQAFRAIDAVPFEVVHDTILHGSPADLARKVAVYAASGLRHIALWNVTFFSDPSLVGPSYRWLAEAKDEIKRIPV